LKLPQRNSEIEPENAIYSARSLVLESFLFRNRFPMSNLNRRRFLTQSAVVSIAAIGSAKMVHQSMAAETAASPNEPIRVCIAGLNGRLGYPAERKDPSYVDAGDTANTEVSIYDYGDKTIVFETRGLDVSESSGPEIDKIFGRNKEDQNRIGVIFYGTTGYAAQLQYHHGVALDKDLRRRQRIQNG
jgi:hypothetical protein